MEDEKKIDTFLDIRYIIYPLNILCQNFIKIGRASLENFARKALEGGVSMKMVRFHKYGFKNGGLV